MGRAGKNNLGEFLQIHFKFSIKKSPCTDNLNYLEENPVSTRRKPLYNSLPIYEEPIFDALRKGQISDRAYELSFKRNGR